MDLPGEWLSVKGAGLMLGVGSVAVHRLIGEGKLPYHRFGSGYRLKRADIEKYRDEQGGDQGGVREPRRPTPPTGSGSEALEAGG